MYKKSKSGIFRPYKGIYRNEKGEVIFKDVTNKVLYEKKE